jgi:hypothetical protein
MVFAVMLVPQYFQPLLSVLYILYKKSGITTKTRYMEIAGAGKKC